MAEPSLFVMPQPQGTPPTSSAAISRAREHGHHTRSRGGPGGVDGDDVSVRFRGPYHDRVELARAVDVVGVASLPGEEAAVFLPPDGGTNSVLSHDQPPIVEAAACTAFTMLW